MTFDPENITFFAKTDARGSNVPFGIKAKDRTRHMYVIGKTGMGKSTLLENMAVQDIKNGEGMAFIDPHGQTAETLLNYIPESRKDDVLYFAPFDMDHPVSFNVMEDVGPDKRHLVVSGLMSVFKKIWIDAWSARMEYILSNTLLALLEYPDATLLGVNRMLSDKEYRRAVIDNISDPAVKSFWVDEFLNYNERYMQEAGDAIKNKIGQFTANPLIRNIIGQPKSSFDIREIMDERKILIMNLSKGLVGETNANLLGSMLTTRIYLAAMSRADCAPDVMAKLPNFYFFVDEFQSFANATFADILSEARKYKLNLTIAHQYIEQMEEEVRNAVFGNVGTIVSFRVGPFDAEVLETIFTPQFLATDICNLGFAQVYLTLMIDGIGSQPFSATTLPPIEPSEISYRECVIDASRKQFAQPRAEIEEAVTAFHEPVKKAGNDGGRGNNPPFPPKKNSQSGGAGKPKGGSHERFERSGNNGGGQNGSSRPDREKKADTKGNQESSPVKQKNLDELRSVLQSIASDSSANERTPKKAEAEKKDVKKESREPVKENNKKPERKLTPRPEESTKSKPVRQDRREQDAPRAEAQPAPVSETARREKIDRTDHELRDAAQASPQSKNDSSSPKNQPPRDAQPPQKQNTQKPTVAPEAAGAVDLKTALAEVLNPPQSPETKPEQPKDPKPKPTPQNKLDAKELQRMMRVGVNDSSPFKK